MLYTPKRTPFKAILENFENITLYPIIEAGETVSYGEGINLKAMVGVENPNEIIIEPGYLITNYINIQTFLPIRTLTKLGVAVWILKLELLRFIVGWASQHIIKQLVGGL